MYSQKSRKYNREINYLNRLSSLVALIPTLRAGFRKSGLECPTLDQLEKNLPNNAKLKSVDTVKKTLSLS